MVPMAGLMPGPQELIIILIIVLLLFGGSRLAGLGKSTGRAIKEFKEETKGLKAGETPPPVVGSAGQIPYQTEAGSTVVPSPQTGSPSVAPPQGGTPYTQPPQPQDQPYDFPPHVGGSQPTNGAHIQGPAAERDARRDV